MDSIFKIDKHTFDEASKLFNSGVKGADIALSLTGNPLIEGMRREGWEYDQIGQVIEDQVRSERQANQLKLEGLAQLDREDVPDGVTGWAMDFPVEMGKAVMGAGKRAIGMIGEQVAEHPFATAAGIAAGAFAPAVAPAALAARLSPMALSALMSALGYTGVEAVGHARNNEPVILPALKSLGTGVLIGGAAAKGGLSGLIRASGASGAISGGTAYERGLPTDKILEETAGAALVPPVMASGLRVGQAGLEKSYQALKESISPPSEGEVAYGAIGDPNLPPLPVKSPTAAQLLAGLGGEMRFRTTLEGYMNHLQTSMMSSLDKIIKLSGADPMRAEQLYTIKNNIIEQMSSTARNALERAASALEPMTGDPRIILGQIEQGISQAVKQVNDWFNSKLPTDQAVSRTDLGETGKMIHDTFRRTVSEPAYAEYDRVAAALDESTAPVSEAAWKNVENVVNQFSRENPQILVGQKGMGTSNKMGGIAQDQLNRAEQISQAVGRGEALNEVKQTILDSAEPQIRTLRPGEQAKARQFLNEELNSNPEYNAILEELNGIIEKAQAGQLKMYHLRNMYKNLNTLFASVMNDPGGIGRRIYTGLKDAVVKAMEDVVAAEEAAGRSTGVALEDFRAINKKLATEVYPRRDQINALIGNKYQQTPARADEIAGKLIGGYQKELSNFKAAMELVPGLEPVVRDTILAEIKNLPSEQWGEAIRKYPGLEKVLGPIVEEYQTRRSRIPTKPTEVMDVFARKEPATIGKQAEDMVKRESAVAFIDTVDPQLREQLAAQQALTEVQGELGAMEGTSMKKAAAGPVLPDNPAYAGTKAAKVMSDAINEITRGKLKMTKDEITGAGLIDELPDTSARSIINKMVGEPAKFTPEDTKAMFKRAAQADPTGYPKFIESILSELFTEGPGKPHMGEIADIGTDISGNLTAMHILEAAIQAHPNPNVRANLVPMISKLTALIPAAKTGLTIEQGLGRTPKPTVARLRETSSAGKIVADAARSAVSVVAPLSNTVRFITMVGGLLTSAFGPTIMGKLLLSNEGLPLRSIMEAGMRGVGTTMIQGVKEKKNVKEQPTAK